MSTYGTGFVESELILAAQAGDTETMTRLITDMHPHERRVLALACDRLADWLDRLPYPRGTH